ncbi:unknown [Clostridium sp. CAG:58]|nr:unknown [Clostridium sp. CAG:58]
MHPFIDWQHGRDHDTEGGSAAAVQMADECDDASHDTDAHHAVFHQKHQLPDDHVEHPGVGHDTEIQDTEHEQGRCGTGAGKAALNEGCNVLPGIIFSQDQHKSQDHRKNDEGNAGQGLTFEQCHHDGDDTGESKDSYKGTRHTFSLL